MMIKFRLAALLGGLCIGMFAATGAIAEDDWISSDEGAKVSMYGLLTVKPENNCTWTGAKDADGYGQGAGTLRCFQKKPPVVNLLFIMEGTMKQGKFEGQTKFRAGNYTYEGQYEAGLRSGSGTMKWSDGRIYEGNWSQNFFDGQGTMKIPDGRVYQGNYVKGAMQGKGTMKFPDGSSYEGDWANGAPSGKGLNKNKDGLVTYEGDYVAGKHTGKGIQRFGDGARYEGEFLNDAFNGKGVLYGPNGKVLMQGVWKNNKFTSEVKGAE